MTLDFRKRNKGAGDKPLPLKQRTSSSSDRRDYSHNTWTSLLVLIKFREFFVTVDHFSIWRRHLAWAFEDGKDLRIYMIQRCASNMVFMSLLLSTELGVLFNSAQVTTEVRHNLVNSKHGTISFWAGLLIIISALLTILSLISTFTAWAMVSSIDNANAHCILRSSIGQYAAELPGRLIVCSIYSFLISFMLFFFLLLPLGFWSILLLVSTSGLFLHVVSVFSGFGRIIMHTGAMSKSRIFSPEYEEFLVPDSLHSNLLKKAKCNLAHNTSIIRQYRRKQQPVDRSLGEEQLWDHLNGNPDRHYFGTTTHAKSDEILSARPRADSIVRFADEELGMTRNTSGAASANGHSNRGGGGNLKHGASPIQHHRRNMTPLSALSEASGSQRSNFSEITLDQDNRSSTSAKKSNMHTNTSTRPPPVPFKSENSVRNVSHASLEQWLQGATSSQGDRKNAVDNSVSRSATLGKDEQSPDTTVENQDVSQTPDETLPLLHFHAPPQEVVAKQPSSASNDLQMWRLESDSPVSRGLLSISSDRRSEKGLSEEERFSLDYGESFSDGEIDDVDQGECNYFYYNHQTEGSNGSSPVRDERTNLLGERSNGNTFYSGAKPPSHSASSPPR